MKKKLCFKSNKNRGLTSLNNMANSYMSTANKIWIAIIVSLISIPILTITKSIFSGTLVTISDINNSLYSQDGLLLFFMIAISTCCAMLFQNRALDIWDNIDSTTQTHNKTE